MKWYCKVSIAFLLAILFGCNRNNQCAENPLVVYKTFTVDSNCVFRGAYDKPPFLITVMSIIYSDSLVHNYLVAHDTSTVDAEYKYIVESIMLINRGDSLFRVPYLYSMLQNYASIYDTLSIYLGLSSGSSSKPQTMWEYLHNPKNYSRYAKNFPLLRKKKKWFEYVLDESLQKPITRPDHSGDGIDFDPDSVVIRPLLPEPKRQMILFQSLPDKMVMELWLDNLTVNNVHVVSNNREYLKLNGEYGFKYALPPKLVRHLIEASIKGRTCNRDW